MAIAYQLLMDQRGLPLRLRGTIGGNGFLGPVLQTANSSEFLYQTSMLDDQGRAMFAQAFQHMQMKMTQNITEVPYLLLGTIFADPTGARPTLFQNLTSYSDHASPLYTQRPFYMLACFKYLNTSLDLRRQLHVGDSAFFRYGDLTLIFSFASDWVRDISNLTQYVLDKSRVLLYTGQLDALFPSVNQRAYITTLNWAHATQYRNASRSLWRPPTWNPFMGYAGYMKQVTNFTEVVVLGMSHYGAAEKPDEAYYLITSFIEEDKVVSPQNSPQQGNGAAQPSSV